MVTRMRWARASMVAAPLQGQIDALQLLLVPSRIRIYAYFER